MRLVVDLHHVFHRKLGVALGGGEPLVAKHLLNGAQVGAFFQHVCAKGVTQGMGMDIGRKSFGDGNFLMMRPTLRVVRRPPR